MSELNNDSPKKHGGGPKTPEGKRRSSLNSVRHGCTASTVCLPEEDSSKFDELLADYIDEYAPATKLELDLVHELAAVRWRMQRLWGIETTMLGITAQRTRRRAEDEWKNASQNIRVTVAFMDLADNSRSLALLRRYETGFTRRFHQILGEIERLQAKRKTQQVQNEPAQNQSQNAQVPQSTNTPQPTAPAKPILRNELGQPLILSRRDDKTPPPGDKLPLKIPQKEDDAA